MITLKSIALASVMLISANASAELIATDWKSTNDGLATLDTESGIEWIDLTVTHGMSINAVSNLLSTEYLGWRLPTRDEVIELARNTFTDKAIPSPSYGAAPTEAGSTFSEMFGFTTGSSTYGTYIHANATYLFGIDNAGINTYFDFRVSSSLSTSRGADGVFLVNDGGVTLSSIANPSLNANNADAPVNQESVSVPVPATLGLFGLMGMLFMRRKSA